MFRTGRSAQLVASRVAPRAVVAPRIAVQPFSTSLRCCNAPPSGSGHSDEELLKRIKDEVKTAMKGKQSDVAGILKSLLSDHQYSQKQGGGTPATVVSIIQKAISRRKEAAEQYSSANRHDLAEKEHKEASLIEKFLPAQLGEGELKTIVEEVYKGIMGQGIDGKKIMGVIMKELKEKVGGAADPRKLKELVDAVIGAGGSGGKK